MFAAHGNLEAYAPTPDQGRAPPFVALPRAVTHGRLRARNAGATGRSRRLRRGLTVRTSQRCPVSRDEVKAMTAPIPGHAAKASWRAYNAAHRALRRGTVTAPRMNRSADAPPLGLRSCRQSSRPAPTQPLHQGGGHAGPSLPPKRRVCAPVRPVGHFSGAYPFVPPPVPPSSSPPSPAPGFRPPSPAGNPFTIGEEN